MIQRQREGSHCHRGVPNQVYSKSKIVIFRAIRRLAPFLVSDRESIFTGPGSGTNADLCASARPDAMSTPPLRVTAAGEPADGGARNPPAQTHTPKRCHRPPLRSEGASNHPRKQAHNPRWHGPSNAALATLHATLHDRSLRAHSRVAQRSHQGSAAERRCPPTTSPSLPPPSHSCTLTLTPDCP